MKTTVARLIGCAIALSILAGCAHQRFISAASVADMGPRIVTKNRYRLVCLGNATADGNYEATSSNIRELDNVEVFEKLKKVQPGVFADDGMPFVMRDIEQPTEMSYGWTVLFPWLTLGLLPGCMTFETTWRCDVDVVDAPNAHARFERIQRHDTAHNAPIPLPLLCTFMYLGDVGSLGNAGKYKGSRRFSTHNLLNIAGEGNFFRDCINGDEALAYGVAVSLKKMEEEGRIDVSKHGNIADNKLDKLESDIELMDFMRIDGDDYTYAFSARCGKDMTMARSSQAKRALISMIREDFSASFPAVTPSSLVVIFKELMLEGSVMRGKALVLYLHVKSLVYDSSTRSGVMGIRVLPGQLSEARQYVRKNIEHIVREKNVALAAGKVPPSAIFRLLGETLKDDVLEVKFSAE